MTVVKNIYYNVRPILSRNAFINLIIGGRGTGKTFNCKKFCIEDFIKNGRQFFYVRRYNTEVELALTGFFEQLQHEGFFTDREFSVKKKKKHLTEFIMDGEVIGYACALSTSPIIKSASFPDVYNLIFDEALIPRGSSYHYLKNEIILFLELLESVFRLRNGRVLILSNAITVANPYYDYWDIVPKVGKQFEMYHNGDICLEQVVNRDFIEVKKKSAIGRLIAGTKYGEYAIENKMLQDNGAFIAFKPHNAKVVGVIKVDGVTYGLWSYHKTGCYYVSGYYDPTCRHILALKADDHTETTKLSGSGDMLLVRLKSAYENACLYFESEKCKKRVLGCIMPSLY